MGPRPVIPALRAVARPRGLPWRSLPQGHRAFSRALPLRTAPATSTTAPPLGCNPYRRGFSSTTKLFHPDPALDTETDTGTSPTEQQDTTTKKTSEPLNILFCGSDGFSSAALQALYDEHVRNPELIRSIEVVVRPAKRFGRKQTDVRKPPIRTLAEKLGLPLHERDTFTGWDMPSSTNLIIAVSFGLFVPPRLLNAARYGGLNLHPSLLPDLRGPAPLHHALLRRRELTGVTLQTLHPEHFDRGVVLAQTPADPADPGALRIPADYCIVREVLQLVLPVAPTMLVQGLRDGVHVPPLEDKGWEARLVSESESSGEDSSAAYARRLAALRRLGGDVNEESGLEPVHAPKITSRDRQVRLSMLVGNADDASALQPREGGVEEEMKVVGPLVLRQHVMGRLWFHSVDQRTGGLRRIIVAATEAINPLTVTEDERQWRTPQVVAKPPASETPAATEGEATTTTATRTRIVIPFLDIPAPETFTPPSTPSDSESSSSTKSNKNTQNNDIIIPDDSDITYLSLAVDPPPPDEKQHGGNLYLAPDFRVTYLLPQGKKWARPRKALRNFAVGKVDG